MTWTPHVTVAAIIEDSAPSGERRFLMVEEIAGTRTVFNQPAGHLEDGESLLKAVEREVLEETGYAFEPTAFVGSYLWRVPESGVSYLRFAIAGRVRPKRVHTDLDEGIVAAHWLPQADINADRLPLRSPLVQLCLGDYLSGNRHPLHLLRHVL